MAPKKQNVGKGKAVAGTSGPPEEVPKTRAKRRDREQIERDNQEGWEASIKERGVKNERHIVDDGLWPANFEPFAAIRDQVFVDVAEIATALDYQRPTGPVNFPRPDETFDQNEIAGYLYEHRRNARIPHWPGRFTTAYRFINQVICFNLYPRGREGAPQRSVGNLMYAFMGEDTVSDWALYIFGQMCDFRDAPNTLRMPFPCLVTKILRTRNVPGKRFYSNDDLLPGDLDSSFIHRSMAQLRGVEGSLLTPPPASASTKTWLEKIFGCLTGLARSQRKLKREQRQLARNQADLLDRQRHMEAQMSGDNPGPFRPRRWPALEVSDDFGDEPEEEQHSDAGDGN
ncbi:hypothetical protein RHGRI_023282 [Rhododendron griersonianum]|uniref:Transposase n=3 Tax=Rhododendron griersonianum TaxID=479676 RepID=A0AAV6J4P6_9ERIC|nr:hypothetical protein RHGRI_023282 [Rhododendron griersonianum]